MSRNAKILIDLAVLAAVYGIWLLPKWRPLGKRPLLVYTLMYGCLAGIVRFTLMPVLTALPFCFDHPYVPMHMAPFEDVILRHGDYVRQIVLNIALFVPFGVLLPLCRSCCGKRCSFWCCLLLTLAAGCGMKKRRAFAVGVGSGAVEPVGAAVMLALTGLLQPLLPWCLAFAAGAMLFVVADQLLPEIDGRKSALGVAAFAAGFLVMMVLDVALG